MATARAQAMAGLGVHARHVRQGAGSREGGGDAEDEPPPPPERVYTAEDDEFPLEWLKRVVKRALWTPYNYWFMAGLLVVLDMVLTMIVVLAVPYTEIDFIAYMQQAHIFLRGERRYDRLVGDTGPCYYPALHVYLSSALSYLSSGGRFLRSTQALYGVVYILCEIAAMAAYKAAGAPPILLPLLMASKRLHSVFVLRLFNDCWAVVFMYLGIWAMCRGAWRTASVLYSLALGVKMNILLYAPAMAAIYLRALGLQRSIIEALRVLLIQALLALPFLMQDPRSYGSFAFNLSREFLYKWTVNWRFIDEKTFLSPQFANGLLASHATLVLAWMAFRWTGVGQIGVQWIAQASRKPVATHDDKARRPSGRFIVTALFTSNLIGITCARSLHYQFYSWYAHQIPLLVYLATLPRLVKIALPICIEMAWNTFPSTNASSHMLLATHLVLLAGLWASHADNAITDEERSNDEKRALAVLYRKYDIPSRQQLPLPEKE